MQDVKTCNNTEDEIDLRELWKTIVKRKKMIALVTSLVTCAAIVYALVKTPIYEAKAIIAIGYNNSNSNNDNGAQYNLIEEPISLVTRIKANNSFISADFVKKSMNLVELSVQSLSKTAAIEKIESTINEIKIRHQTSLDAYILLIKEKINNLNEQKIELQNEKEALANFIAQKTAKIDQIMNQNPTVAAIYTIELNNKSSDLSALKNKIYEINNKVNDLSIAISSINIQPTELLGKILTHDYPIKPKKTLIVIVAFVTGLILSIFLAFFLEFIGKNEHE